MKIIQRLVAAKKMKGGGGDLIVIGKCINSFLSFVIFLIQDKFVRLGRKTRHLKRSSRSEKRRCKSICMYCIDVYIHHSM